MLLIEALHIIFMVAWFAGLFYLPRLFVYHATSSDRVSIERFKIMEYKLYYMIMFPAAILTTVFGFWLISYNPNYLLHQTWLQIKLILVLLLWIYHFYCGALVKRFAEDKNRFSPVFYRFFNEAPTVLLFAIVILAVVKP